MDTKIILNPDVRASGDPKVGELSPIKTQIFYPLEIKQSSLSPDVGKGVFAQEPIKKGSVIAIGGGQITNELSKASRDRNYIGVFDETHFIAPLDFDKLTPNWLINHSCEPNAKIIGRLVIIARNDIAKGEELTLHYSPIVAGDIEWSMECRCGLSHCRKKITNDDWEDRHLFYSHLDEWPSFIQIRGLKNESLIATMDVIEQQKKKIERTLSYISHGMRSPLSVLKGYVENCATTSDEDALEYKKAAKRSIEKLLHMADDLDLIIQ